MHIFLRSRLGLIVCSLVAFLLALAQPSAALVPFALGATTEVTDLDEALKIFFNEPIVENVVTDTEFLDAFTLDTNVQYEQSTGGRYIETAQYFQLPGGVGARATGDYIPVPNGPVIQNSRVYLKKLQAVTEMSGEVMKRVRGDMGAYLNWMERALPDIVTRLKDSVDRQLIGLGGGIKARVADAAPDATLGIDTAYGATLNSAALAYAWQLFLEGESIVFSADVDANPLRSTGADRAAIVTNIDQANGILTLDHLPTGVLDNDWIFEGDISGHSGPDAAVADKEIMGLLGMVDDGSLLATFQNLLRSSYRLWNAIAIDGASAALGFDGTLTEDVLTYADDETFTSGGGIVDMLVTSRSANRGYWKSLRGDRSFNDPRTYMGGKGEPLSIRLGNRTVQLRVARKMPYALCFGLTTSTFKRWELDGFQWDDTTGAIWNRVTDATGRKDAFYAVGNWYLQTGCLAPRKNFRISNLAAA